MLNPKCIRGKTWTSTFTNSEDPDEMQHYVAFHLGLHFLKTFKVKKIFRQKNAIFYLNYNLTPLDMYNAISQVYCIKPEERIHKYTKG